MHLVSDYIRSAGKGTCYVCRAHRRGPDELILDFEREIDFEGALQVCAPCIKEAAGITGAIEEAVAAIRAELEIEVARRLEAEVALDAAERAMDAMKIYRAARPRKPAPAEDA